MRRGVCAKAPAANHRRRRGQIKPFEQLHVDRARRRRRCRSSVGSTMKQFACDIDDRMPEPWSPVVRTVHPPSPSRREDAALELGAARRLADRRRAAAP